MGVGVAVGKGVDVSVIVGTRVTLGRGVASGTGGVLMHAANPTNTTISPTPRKIFTPHAPREIMSFESFKVNSAVTKRYPTQSSSSRNPA